MMNHRVACKTSPPSASTTINPSSYGGKHKKVSPYPYSKFSSQCLSSFDSTSLFPSSKLKSHNAPPSSAKVVLPAKSVSQKRYTSASVPLYLQAPSFINNSKGSLAEFAAQMSCLFWFETTAKLNAIENNQDSVPTLAPGVSPTLDFQNWVVTVLSTTQVSYNVILLGLMFIYRLKKFNSAIKGKSGSEFRLFTIALILGSKILDDNTYTNKTWAKVSGISLQEIHIMEVEFLSNVRYNLFASNDEWSEWHAKLKRFSDFYHRMSLITEDNEQFVFKAPPALHISPSIGLASPLLSLSPASKLPPMDKSLSILPSWSPSVNNGALYTPLLPRLGNEIPPSGNSRKHGRDESTDEHPVKRRAICNPIIANFQPSSTLPSMPALLSVSTPTPTFSRLPMHHSPQNKCLLRSNNPSSGSNLTPSIPTISHQIHPAPARAIPSAHKQFSSTGRISYTGFTSTVT